MKRLSFIAGATLVGMAAVSCGSRARKSTELKPFPEAEVYAPQKEYDAWMTMQMPHPEICANYDMDKETAALTRVSILDYVQQEGLTMAGMHFPEPAFIFPEQEL